VVPEREFRTVANYQRNLILVITVLGLLLAALMAVFMDRLVNARLAKAIARIRQLGQYTLEEKLGEGGMGEVYRASHAMLRRPTAIKLLRTGAATSEEDLERFEQEVQATSRLTHPNTIAIYDYGRTENNVFYYAMEYIQGITLYDLVVNHGPVEPARVIHILIQVCGSLFEAHSQRFIHRDIKPANIMLCRRGAQCDVAKVLDFGLVTEPTPTEGEVELPEEIHGTPGYIPPETIEPPHIVDARGDIYTIGAVGYFLLTGTHVFDGRTAEVLCAQHVGLDPQPPSERLGRALPDDLCQVILACLEKEPESRPQSARIMAEQLEGCRDHGHWTRKRAEQWWEQQNTAATSNEPPDAAPVANQTMWVSGR